MRAIVNTGPNLLEMQDLPVPEPGPGQVRIRTGACGICATDLEMIAGWKRTSFPAICGHEWAGTVDAVGDGVSESLVGSRCVAENVLADGGEVGFEHPGGYAELFLTEASRLHLLPERFPLSTANLIEPLAVCVRGLRRLRADFGEPVLILGDGPIGLIFTMLLSGRQTYLIGGREERLRLAAALGAVKALNYHEFEGGVAQAAKSRMMPRFPTIIEASGSGAAMNAAVELAAREGRILVIGEYGHATAGFLWNIMLREIELIGSNASAGAWPEAVKLATEGDLPLDRLISLRLPASRFAEGIDAARGRNSGCIKVVLEWGE